MTPASPLPWVLHPMFQAYIVQADQSGKRIGGAADPDVEAENYARVIARMDASTCDRFPEFHRSRPWSYEAKADARYIVHACNLYPELLAALKEAREVIETLAHAGADSKGVYGCNHCGFPFDGPHDDGCCVPPTLKQCDAALAKAEGVTHG